MKRWIAMALALGILMSLAGCGSAGQESLGLMSGIVAEPVPSTDILEESAAPLTQFGLSLLRETMTAGENALVSPLSVLCALGMTANGAREQTLAQMEAAFGMDRQTLNRWLFAFLQQLPREKTCRLLLSNSLWFRDAPDLTVEQLFLQTNANYYGADIYKAPFDDSTLRQINDLVKEKTDGMIDGILDEIPADAMMYLVNALCFDAQWSKPYLESQMWNGTFTTEDGQSRTVTMMRSEESRFLEDANATGFLKYYEGRRCAFAALLPREGLSVEDYLAGLTGENLQRMLEDAGSTTVYAQLPKFETEFSAELGAALEAMGMTDAFDGSKADLRALGSSSQGNLYINRVLHKTFLSVDGMGTRAGASTVVEVMKESALENTETVILDRPFVYMLIDCETNLPFFMGTMRDVEGG